MFDYVLVDTKQHLRVPCLFWLAEQHLKDLKDPIMDGVLLETENMLARGRMDLPLSLCFAALRGDDLLLHQLLKRGLDVHESDNSGRTALVIDNILSSSTSNYDDAKFYCLFNFLFFVFFHVKPAYSSV